jgi:hypothetical protein
MPTPELESITIKRGLVDTDLLLLLLTEASDAALRQMDHQLRASSELDAAAVALKTF